MLSNLGFYSGYQIVPSSNSKCSSSTQIADFGFSALGTGDFPFNPAFDSHKLTAPETDSRNDRFPTFDLQPEPEPRPPPPAPSRGPTPSFAPPPPPRRESIPLEQPDFPEFSFPGFDSLRDGGFKDDVKASKDFDDFVLHEEVLPPAHPTLYHEDLNNKPHLFTADPYGAHPHHAPHHDPYHAPHHEPHHDPYHAPHHEFHHDPALVGFHQGGYHEPDPYHAPHSGYHEPEPYHAPKPKQPVLLEKRPYEVKEIKALPVALHDTYTNFDCRKAPYPNRHYADPESGCQVFQSKQTPCSRFLK